VAIPQKGISTKWRQKAERGIGVLPCSRPAERKGDKREKGKNPAYRKKRTAAFHEWLVFTKGYGAAKRER